MIYRVKSKTGLSHLWTFESFRAAVGGRLLDYEKGLPASPSRIEIYYKTEVEVPEEVFEKYGLWGKECYDILQNKIIIGHGSHMELEKKLGILNGSGYYDIIRKLKEIDRERDLKGLSVHSEFSCIADTLEMLKPEFGEGSGTRIDIQNEDEFRRLVFGSQRCSMNMWVAHGIGQAVAKAIDESSSQPDVVSHFGFLNNFLLFWNMVDINLL